MVFSSKSASNTYPSLSFSDEGDVSILRTHIEAQTKKLAEQSDIIQKKSDVIDQQKKRIAQLEEYLRLVRAQRFGPSSEKHPAQQEMVFNSAEAMADEEAELEDTAAQQALEELKEMTEPASNKKRGRKGLPSNIPRVQVRLELSEEEKAGAVDTFFTVIKEELDIEPAKAQVIEYLQEKAVFIDSADNDNNNDEPQTRIVAAEQPRHPLNKCIASIGLLCYIIIAKYTDGLSLYAIEKMITRYGGSITRTAMANWVIRLATEFQPIVNLAREHQLEYDYIQIDETRVQVLKEPDKPAQSKQWMWVSKGGPPDKPVVLFDYDPSRKAEVASRLLEGFQGYVQCDALSSYNALCLSEHITRLGCFDHARRKFSEAIKAQAKTKKMKPSLADVGLAKINALYRLERTIKDLSPKEKYQKRQSIAIPLLNDLKNWLTSKVDKTPKDQLTYKAISYALNNWDALVVYCEDGRLHISNAGAENAIRPFAVGRRRWLFCDTPSGANASAIHYSLIETAKANGLEPFEYYKAILPKLAYAKTVEDWEALLPWNVKANLKNSDK